MTYIVLDMEWNQPMTQADKQRSPAVLRGEIVQIGAVKLDRDFQVSETFKIMIKPVYYTKMHWKVSKLTGIKNKDLTDGVPFAQAMERFRDWCGDDVVLLTWGPDDIRILGENLCAHYLEAPWIRGTYNVQVIFAYQVAGERGQMSLTEAMKQLGEPALEAHDALNDAYNTAVICSRLDMAAGLARYESLAKEMKCAGANRDQEVKAVAGQLEGEPEGKTYFKHRQALADPDVITYHCLDCDEKAMCSGLVRQNVDKYIGLGKCRRGHEHLVRIRFRRQPDRSFRVSRVLREMNEENRRYYNSKKNLKQKKDQEPSKV